MISYENGTINPDFVEQSPMPDLTPDGGSFDLIDSRSIRFIKKLRTSQVEFVVAGTDNVVGIINASTEGIEIAANRTAITSTVDGNTASIIVNAAGIATNVSDISGNTTNISVNATDISTNVSDISGNTSNISQNATNISLRILKHVTGGATDEILSEINLSEEVITINADKISIAGTTVFTSGWATATDAESDINVLNTANAPAAAGADVTADNTAASIAGQGTLATQDIIGAIDCDTTIIDGGKVITGLLTATNIQTGTFSAIPYQSAASGARVLIFPDADTGIQIIDNGAADVFKVLVGGADVGDVIIGNYAGDQGLKYDKSAGTILYKNLAWSEVVNDDTNKPDNNATIGGILGTNISGGGTSDNQINNNGYISHLSADVIDAGTLNANSITVSNFTVGTNVGLGTAEDSAGVTTIIGDTVTTTYLNAKNIIAGSVAAENITGTYITGKTIRTAANGARVQLDNSNYLQCIDSSGYTRVKIDTEKIIFKDSSNNDSIHIYGSATNAVIFVGQDGTDNSTFILDTADGSDGVRMYYMEVPAVSATLGSMWLSADTTRNAAANIVLNAAQIVPADGTTDFGNASYKWDKAHIKHLYSTSTNEFLDLTNTDGRLKQNLICYTDINKNIGDSTHRFASVFGQHIRCDELDNNAGTKFIDLSGGKVDCFKPLVLNTLSSYPSTPDTGEMFWHTTVGAIMVYNGSAWETVTSA